jgi:hypothetical protein
MSIALFGVILADRFVNDSLTMFSSGALGTILSLLFCARVKPGLCARCQYDIRSSLEFGRCPECGLAI